MRVLATALLIAGAAAAEEWSFAFENGDRVRARLAALRDGVVLLEIPATPRAVQVPFGSVATAEPAPGARENGQGPTQILRLRDGGALLGTSRAIREGRVEFDVESLGVLKIPGRDVAELLDADDALRAYRRSLSATPSLSAEPLTAARFRVLWARLGAEDGNGAWQAHRELVEAGAGAVDHLAERLRTQPDAPDTIDALIGGLEDDSPEARTLAFARLRGLGEIARPQLTEAASRRASPEARRQIALLLAQDAEARDEPDAEVVRFLRAVRVLEEIGAEKARALLERLSKAGPRTPTAREAAEALERMRRTG
jgi:hypothetical protein